MFSPASVLSYEDFPLNDVTGYLDLSFDSAIDFPIYLISSSIRNLKFKVNFL